MSIWLPPAVEQQNREAFAEHQRELAGQYRTLEHMRHWNKLLQEISMDLQLVKAHDDTDGYGGLKPGYYYVIKNNHGAPPDVVCHEGPNGEFREPDSSLLEKLRKGHLWSNRSMKAMKEADKALQRAAEREREREKEDRIEEVVQRLDSMNRTQALIKDKPF